ncbi:Biosynthetic arginine decarboxylase [Carnimonas sp. R-84981]|uniref:biosynthetic arginine decarboxylase n=1 Tax=Carnimonas bestiolae TaxID=3402172 RepID=UPI003EDBE41B
MNNDNSTYSINDARRVYNIDHWGGGYYDLDAQGDVVVTPTLGDGAKASQIKLTELLQQAKQSGLRLPLLMRFSNILHSRVALLCEAFDSAIEDYGYQGGYTAVYPIKVNQQRRVVEELLATPQRSAGRVGLEAGSKPELLAVLALSSEGASTIVCNGYKDREYIRLALMGEKLGHRVYLVVEKESELSLIIEEARALGVKPRIGLRARLMSVGKGKWESSGGAKSKFGLTAQQVLDVIERLRSEQMLDCLDLIHFHLGSQIANIHDIKRGLTECARFFHSLHAQGAVIKVVDVGGGLGIDYEGTRSRSHCSINYSLGEYANNVVGTFHQLCQQEGLPHPDIISESGRALTAHHAVLITNVIDEEKQLPATMPKRSQGEPLLETLWDTHNALNQRQPPLMLAEYYHDLTQSFSDLQYRFVLGDISLEQRAEGEAVYIAACHSLRHHLDPRNRAHREILDELAEKLADKLFVNFSLFQSLPDAWGIDQVFPVMPLSGLQRPATRRGIIQDITCDSDGRFDHYIDGESVDTSLPLPEWAEGEDHLLGMFLVGAYQEILGDLHNLFGDTDSVDVSVDALGHWQLSSPIRGDSVAGVLEYVNFDIAEFHQRYQSQLDQHSDLTDHEREQFMETLAAGLQGYTYLASGC